MKRFALAVLLLLGLGLVAIALSFVFWRRGGLPMRSGMHRIPGLAASVEVRFDQWGVPHVTAKSARDLAAALGWLHANDRMAQLELGRRAAAGRLSEIFGERTLEVDRSMRQLRLRKTAEAYEKVLGGESRALLEAYAAGVNAWLRTRTGDLPPELRFLDVVPEPWQPVDSLCFVLLMSRDLCYPAILEERRFEWLCLLGPEKTLDLIGQRGGSVAEEVRSKAEECARGWKARRSLDEREELRGGSNAWVVGGSLTRSNIPIVANDPHLELGMPCTWYQALLRAPDYEAAGMTLPGLPIVAIGQTPSIAWSFTNAEIDTNDLFLEELDPQGTAVKRGFGWSPVQREHETIDVRGGSTVAIELLSSEVGPLLPADPDRALPVRSLAWTAYQAFDPIAPFLAIARAKTVEEIPANIASFVAPVQNLLVADRSGGILHTLLGRVPHRARGDGKLPAPGWDANAIWRGLLPADANPRILRPKQDRMASANDPLVFDQSPQSMPGDFAGSWRVERIAYLASLRRDWQADLLAQIQTDTVSTYALEIVWALPAGMSGDAAKAREALVAWDGHMDKTGVAALFALFERELADSIWGDELRTLGLPALGVLGRTHNVARAMRNEIDPAWYDDVTTREVQESREQTIQRALTRAWRAGQARFGPEPRTWSYGAINLWTARHPLSSVPVLGRFFGRGPFEVPGSATTVQVFTGGWDGDHIDATHGASMRFVADLADPDRSLVVVAGGQSGHPFDPHYDDQIPVFLAGALRSLYWSAEAIAEHTVSTLRLEP